MTQAHNIAVLELANVYHTPHSPGASRSTHLEVLATASAFITYTEDEPIGALAALTLAVAYQKPNDPNAVRLGLDDLLELADDFMTFIGADEEI